jgi:PPOX class probable F420-dependent enzyme
MEISTALDFAKLFRNGVLTTIKRDGRPQLSNIVYTINDAGNDAGEVRISITADRAKYFNIVRDPRVSVHISRDDFWSYVVLEGDATMSPVAADPNDATVDELVELYRVIGGEHPDWDDYRAAMVNDRRTVVHLRPTNAYGMVLA